MKRLVPSLLLVALALPFGAAHAAPANDALVDATPLAMVSQSVAGDTTGATTEATEPVSACGALGATVWYSLPAATTGVTIRVSNPALGFAIYTADGSEVSCAVPGGSSTFVMNPKPTPTEPSQVHLIQVGGPIDGSTPTGTFDLDIRNRPRPGNDSKANASLIADTAGTYTVDSYTATIEPGEPAASCNTTLQNTVWYRVQATSAKTLSFNTEGSDIDTVVAVYRVTGPGKQDQVGCNDNLDRDRGLFSHTAVTLRGGAEYLVQIGTRGSGSNLAGIKGGDIVLTVAPNGNDTAAAAAWVDGLGTFKGSTVGATAEANESDLPCATTGGPSVWYTFLPTQRAETFAILSPDAEIAVYHPTGLLIGCSLGSGGVTIPSVNSNAGGAWLFNNVLIRVTTPTASSFSLEVIHGAYARASTDVASATVKVDSDSRSTAGTRVCVAGTCQNG